MKKDPRFILFYLIEDFIRWVIKKIKQLKDRINLELVEDDPWGEQAEINEIYKNV